MLTGKLLQRVKISGYKNKKGETKNNFGLVTEMRTINTLLETLKELMETIPRHRFSNYHTKNLYREAVTLFHHDSWLKCKTSV